MLLVRNLSNGRMGLTGLQHTLTVRNITKSYGPHKVLDAVSLDVPKGQFLTLLGPSGSGKTTLMMSIAGFVDPDEGDILVDQHSIIRLPPEKRQFGMVFQGYALFPHLSVAENVRFPLRARGVARADAERAVARVLATVQLEKLADRKPAQLSGGQQQRVALARALVFEPHLLLLDEPLSALDRKLRADLQTELRDIHRRAGMTFIYVTHDQDEAMSMSDTVAIMRDGRIIQVGDPRTLYDRPTTKFVASFLGRSNFIQARVQSVAGGWAQCSANGHALSVASARARAGDDVTIAIRPERMTITPRGDHCGEPYLPGIVEDVTFLGNTLRYAVRTDTLGSLSVETPAWNEVIALGDSVGLTWPVEAAGLVVDDLRSAGQTGDRAS
jgi:putative spermidine/putrescine transport system ATP-binding protein